MADEKDAGPVLGIIDQYTKDLSFENINSLSSMGPNMEQPEIDIQMKVSATNAEKEDNYRVSLNTKIKTVSKGKTLFVLELDYCGEFLIKGFDKTLMDPLLNIECPRLLFPYARSIISSTVSEGGFPPLHLAPVNFADLYQQQLAAQNQTKQ